MRYCSVLQRFFRELGRFAGRGTFVVPLLMAVIAVCAVLLAGHADLRAIRCGGGVVSVIAPSPADRDAACTGAERAIAVLDRLGLPVLSPIVVHVVDDINIGPHASALGTFDPRTRLVKVLSRSAYSVGSADEAILGLPFDRDLHASVSAHEVTHAVFHQHKDRIPLSPAAHEYVAYSVQLSSLPVNHRRRIIERFEGSPFTAVDQISSIILAFDPNSFGIRAYLHFRDAADQHAVLRSLVRASRAGASEWY